MTRNPCGTRKGRRKKKKKKASRSRKPLRYAQGAKETCVYYKRDLAKMGKETYLYDKRALLTLAYLRHVLVSKETYNRPKEAYLYEKRGLLI